MWFGLVWLDFQRYFQGHLIYGLVWFAIAMLLPGVVMQFLCSLQLLCRFCAAAVHCMKTTAVDQMEPLQYTPCSLHANVGISFVFIHFHLLSSSISAVFFEINAVGTSSHRSKRRDHFVVVSAAAQGFGQIRCFLNEFFYECSRGFRRTSRY